MLSSFIYWQNCLVVCYQLFWFYFWFAFYFNPILFIYWPCIHGNINCFYQRISIYLTIYFIDRLEFFNWFFIIIFFQLLSFDPKKFYFNRRSGKMICIIIRNFSHLCWLEIYIFARPFIVKRNCNFFNITIKFKTTNWFPWK